MKKADIWSSDIRIDADSTQHVLHCGIKLDCMQTFLHTTIELSPEVARNAGYQKKLVLQAVGMLKEKARSIRDELNNTDLD